MGKCIGRPNANQDNPNATITLDKRKETDLTFKVVLLGDLYVGKTSILVRIIENDFHEDSYSPTIGVAYLQHKVIQEEQKNEVTLNLWDTGGHSYFKDFIRMYYRDASAALIIFDRTNMESFNSQKDWIRELEEKLDPAETVICLVANKSDLTDKIEVTDEMVKSLIDGWKDNNQSQEYFETSAKTGAGVQEMFSRISQLCHDKRINQPKAPE